MRILEKQSKQMSDTYLLGIFLAVAGGFFDAYTYLIRGHVFANAQTGNIVLLGIHISRGDFEGAFYYFIPILAFAVGVLLAEIIKSKMLENEKIHWRQVILFVEIFLVSVTAFMPIGKMDIVVNIIISFVCSLQVESFKKISGNAAATTMCTGNLRSGTEQLFNGVRNKNKNAVWKSLQYYGIILFFIVGAIIGTILTKQFDIKSVLFAAAVLLIPFVMMFKSK